MDKIKNLSLRKTILLYMAIALLSGYLFSAVIIKIADRTQLRVWGHYVSEAYFETAEAEGPDHVTDFQRPTAYVMTPSDHFVSEVCDFLQTYTILILSMAGSSVAVLLFYRNKLKKPIRELALASKNIAENHLDFHITYENKDEMGVLCSEFERMREQLARNNQTLWRTIEEEKILRAAIAHDIRSPLTVLKGYQEMLMEYLPDAQIDHKQVMEMLSESSHQIERMDSFVETMRKMNSLEGREPAAAEISAAELEADIQAELAILEKEFGKQYTLQVPASNEIFYGDKEIILEVTENLLSNAFRYGKQQIEIMIQTGYSELRVCIKDDGDGFQEDTEKITEAFHTQNAKDSLKHAGIGMYISRLYCEKHGGKLVLKNDEQHGAVMTAIFRRIS